MGVKIVSKMLPSGMHLLKYVHEDDEEGCSSYYALQTRPRTWTIRLVKEEYDALERICLESDGEEESEISFNPCPFCGSNNIRCGMRLNRLNKKDYIISCRKCGAKVNSLDTPFKAIGTWNKRMIPIDIIEPLAGTSLDELQDFISAKADEEEDDV